MRILAFLPVYEQQEHLRAASLAGHEVHVVTTARQPGAAPRVEDGVSVWPLGYWWQALQAARPAVLVLLAADGKAQRLTAGISGVRRLVLEHDDADAGEFVEACTALLPRREREAARRPVPADPLAGLPVRVVAWIHYGVPYRCAGSETMLQTLMRALKGAGMGVLVVVSSVPEAPSSWEVDGVPYMHLSPYGAEMLIRRVRPQVVVTHHHYAARAVAFARTVGARSALLLHSDHEIAARVLKARPDLCVYNTEWVRASVAARYEEADRWLVVHPPVIPGEHRAAAAGDAVTLVNLSRDKGVDTWRAAAAALPDLPFLGVAGAHGRQVRDGMPRNVRLIGQTGNMRDDVWARTRLLTVPSLYESYGMGAVEALASGIPVIAEPTPGLREALGGAATFVDRTETAAWAAAVEGLYEDGPAREAAVAAALARSAHLAHRTEQELKVWADAIQDLADGH
ncbi:glycosyltransferase family 4 protein [Streptomyces sp. NPDC059063]|uniref:glycosyltransferase family 4 protein n=1 Tax=Streptomyces sp. NPDC059063 TaxID=3346712 RepID=UPI003675D920